MIHSLQLDAAARALGPILKFDRPADVLLSRFFREHVSLGSHDRAFIAESVFGALRRKRLIDHLIADATPRQILLVYLVLVSGISVRELRTVLTEDEARWIGSLKAAKPDQLPLAVAADLPDWVVERLQMRMSDLDILALGRALQQPAPLDLRVNTVRGDRESIMHKLAATGIEGEATPFSPLGIRLKGKPALNRHPLFLDGSIEVQDEGSQLLGFLVAPKRRDLVVDFCAGAGGKALMMGAMMSSQGRLYALETSEKRLARMKPRLKRSGLSNVYPRRIESENDHQIKRLQGKIDRVLVDAPCSGLGTLRRNPDLKWRQTPESVNELKSKQGAILRSASRLLKPGARLVYATCSVLAEENEDIVTAFLAENPGFELLNCGECLQEQHIGWKSEVFFQSWPHIHGTDGFFAATISRKA